MCHRYNILGGHQIFTVIANYLSKPTAESWVKMVDDFEIPSVKSSNIEIETSSSDDDKSE